MSVRRTRAHHHPGHSRAQCLQVFRQLSAYLDDELAEQICRDIRQHLGHCPNCDVFLDSLRRTIEFCHHYRTAPLSVAEKSRLRNRILRAAVRYSAC